MYGFLLGYSVDCGENAGSGLGWAGLVYSMIILGVVLDGICW